MSKKKEKKKTNEKNQRKHSGGIVRKFLRPQVVRTAVLALISLFIFILSVYWLPGDLHYQITETYQFSGDEAGSLIFVVLLPTTGPYQEVFEPEIVWPGTISSSQEGRLQVLRFTADLEARKTIEAQISYTVHLWQGGAVWHRERVEPEGLAATPEIQSDHPEIIARAEALRVTGNQQRTARRIFKFTRQHLEWPKAERINADLSALSALQTGVGGDIEHANLMAALGRAEDIPSRVINGLTLPDAMPFIPMSTVWDHPAGAHAWVESYFEDAWHFSDPSSANQLFQRDLFGWVDGRHLAYDEVQNELAVFQPLIAEAEENGTWIAAMNAPLRFVAWSNLSHESVNFIPEVTIRKVWDSRYLLFVSLTLILWTLDWVARGNDRQVGDTTDR
jgi:hypothetical protein